MTSPEYSTPAVGYFPPKSMSSNRDSSAAAYPVKEPSPTNFTPDFALCYPQEHGALEHVFQDKTLRERYLNMHAISSYAYSVTDTQHYLGKDHVDSFRSSTFKRQEGKQRPHSTTVDPTTRGRSLLKAKQGLVGFADGSDMTAMAETGSRKNVISASYAK